MTAAPFVGTTRAPPPSKHRKPRARDASPREPRIASGTRPRRHRLVALPRARSPSPRLRTRVESRQPPRRPRPATSFPLLMALHVDARGGLMLLTAAPYDDEIVTHIRSLPERRYRRQTQDWCIPARRAHLRAVCALIGELEERSIDVNVSAGASARLARLDVGRAVPPRRRHRGRGRLQPAPSAGVARLAGAPIRRGPQDLDGPADAGRRAGDPRSGRPHRPARDHAASPSRTATISRAQSTDDTRQARLRRRAHESEAAVAGRALEALHGRPGLRQPRPRARCCAGHRVVRSHPGQSASRRAVTRPVTAGASESAQFVEHQVRRSLHSVVVVPEIALVHSADHTRRATAALARSAAHRAATASNATGTSDDGNTCRQAPPFAKVARTQTRGHLAKAPPIHGSPLHQIARFARRPCQGVELAPAAGFRGLASSRTRGAIEARHDMLLSADPSGSFRGVQNAPGRCSLRMSRWRQQSIGHEVEVRRGSRRRVQSRSPVPRSQRRAPLSSSRPTACARRSRGAEPDAPRSTGRPRHRRSGRRRR